MQAVATEGNLIMMRLAEDRRLTPPMAQKLQRGLQPEIRIWLALTAHDRVVVSRRKADSNALFHVARGSAEQYARTLVVPKRHFRIAVNYMMENNIPITAPPVFICHETSPERVKEANEKSTARVEIAWPVTGPSSGQR